MSGQRIAIVGNGGFGAALALVLLENGHEVTIWGHDPAYIERVRRERENAKYLPGIELPPEIALTADAATALGQAQMIVSAVPTRHLRAVWTRLKESKVPRVPLLSVTKGVELDTLLRPSEVLRELLPGRPVAVLSGPSHAEEVARRIPASVVVAGSRAAIAEGWQAVFTTERFRVYTNTDPLGVELAGALKNVISIAAGVSDGLGFGDNTKSALVTRGLVEIARLGTALGARKATFAGLAGMGDLITSSFSPHGRNRAVGERIGKGMPLQRIAGEMEMVAEGVDATRSVMKLARRLKIEMPITREVHDMLYKDKDPAAALKSLMRRTTKTEAW